MIRNRTQLFLFLTSFTASHTKQYIFRETLFLGLLLRITDKKMCVTPENNYLSNIAMGFGRDCACCNFVTKP
jgi:hypothetical protein